jgi:hypothetical protein
LDFALGLREMPHRQQDILKGAGVGDERSECVLFPCRDVTQVIGGGPAAEQLSNAVAKQPPDVRASTAVNWDVCIETARRPVRSPDIAATGGDHRLAQDLPDAVIKDIPAVVPQRSRAALSITGGHLLAIIPPSLR